MRQYIQRTGLILLAAHLLSCEKSNNVQEGARFTYPVIGWDELKEITGQKNITINGRFFSQNQTIVEPEIALKFLMNKINPWEIVIPRILLNNINPEQLNWLKNYQGAHASFQVSIERKADGQLHVLKLLSVDLIEGIPAKIEDIVNDPEMYSSFVLKVSGVIGKWLNHKAIYNSAESQTLKQIENGIVVELHALGVTPGNLKLLFQENSATENKKESPIVLEALYQRPWKNDGLAPTGRFVLIHSISHLE